MVCTFFGNREILVSIDKALHEALVDLIENKGVDTFYVGNHGAFDRCVLHHLKKLSKVYPIKYWVVLAYLPTQQNEYEKREQTNFIYPDLENVPPRYAIVKRNEWMLKQADYVVTFVNDITGNACKMREKAEKKGKFIINIGRF